MHSEILDLPLVSSTHAVRPPTSVRHATTTMVAAEPKTSSASGHAPPASTATVAAATAAAAATASSAIASKKALTTAQTYNTNALGARIRNDVVSAVCASSLVAPLITLVDKSIILRTHTPAPLSHIFASSLGQALRHPVAFIVSAPYLLINAVYFSTYAAANLTDTASSTLSNKSPGSVTAGKSKFAATSAVNMAVCLYKDAQLAKAFGATARNVPRASLALFAARDAATVYASFNLPPVLAPWFAGSYSAAQFVAPASMQLLSTPLHLLGLDLYNRPRGMVTAPNPAATSAAATTTTTSPTSIAAAAGSPTTPDVTWRDRWAVVRRDWLPASMGRMCRIIPAFGIGGVVNTKVRAKLMGRIDD